METLGKIFGSPARVKIMRLFFLNRTTGFKVKEIAKRSRVSSDLVRREIKLLSSVSFIKSRGGDWVFDSSFPYISELEELLINTDTLEREAVVKNFRRTGRLKLLILSGVFIKNKDSRVDLLVVGDKLKRGKVDEEIKKLEAEIGAELVYAVFDAKEFAYRLSMYDKLVRDVLDFPHEVIFKARELSTQAPKKA
jgi:hypothetical protein